MTIYAVITQDHDMTNRVDVELFNEKEGAKIYARSTVKGANYYEFDWAPGDDGEVFFCEAGITTATVKQFETIK